MNLAAERCHPQFAHEVLVGEVPVGVEEVPLDQVPVLEALQLQLAKLGHFTTLFHVCNFSFLPHRQNDDLKYWPKFSSGDYNMQDQGKDRPLGCPTCLCCSLPSGESGGVPSRKARAAPGRAGRPQLPRMADRAACRRGT